MVGNVLRVSGYVDGFLEGLGLRVASVRERGERESREWKDQ